MTPRDRRRRAARGFTLLEVLISITLLALIAGICYAAFHLGIRAVGKGEMAVVTAQRLRVATDVLIHQVKSAVVTPAMIDGDAYPYFYGQPTSMSFVTEAGQLGGGGRSRVTYRITEDPAQLVLEETTYFDADTLGGTKPETDEARSAILLDGFRHGRFEFYDGTDTLDCPSNWCSSWNPVEAETIPAAVRIVVEGLFGMDEDVWGQEIPILSVTATYADASGELGDAGELQDCEGVDVGAPGESGSGTGSGSSSSGGTKSGGSNADEEGDEE